MIIGIIMAVLFGGVVVKSMIEVKCEEKDDDVRTCVQTENDREECEDKYSAWWCPK